MTIKKQTTTKYTMIENVDNIRNVIYKNDILPENIWYMVLIEYFNSEIEDNKFVMAVIGEITTNTSFALISIYIPGY